MGGIVITIADIMITIVDIMITIRDIIITIVITLIINIIITRVIIIKGESILGIVMKEIILMFAGPERDIIL
jgi:hypothetical protein